MEIEQRQAPGRCYYTGEVSLLLCRYAHSLRSFSGEVVSLDWLYLWNSNLSGRCCVATLTRYARSLSGLYLCQGCISGKVVSLEVLYLWNSNLSGRCCISGGVVSLEL